MAKQHTFNPCGLSGTVTRLAPTDSNQLQPVLFPHTLQTEQVPAGISEQFPHTSQRCWMKLFDRSFFNEITSLIVACVTTAILLFRSLIGGFMGFLDIESEYGSVKYVQMYFFT